MIKKSIYPVNFNSMFREYDIRGRVNEEELCPENVYRIVKAYAMYLRKRGISKSVVGYDNRECSPAFAESAIRALREMGIDVYYIGLTITPVVYFAQYHLKSEGAVMITASHNPSDWSGFKFGKGYSKTLEPDDIEEVYNYLDMDSTEKCKTGTYQEIDVRDAYIESVCSRIHMGPNKPRVVLDAGNGGAGVFVYEIFQRLGCMTFQLHCDPDTTYPNYFPNPSDIKARESLKNMVIHPYIHADLGLSFDGDGDRLGVIDDKGQNIWSDMILAVLSKQLLDKKSSAKVVFDVKCSRALGEVISNNGGTPIMWKTGHSYIKAKMHEIGADLAGERSGHIFVGGDDYYGFDDGVFVGAKLIEYLSHTDDKLSVVMDKFPKYVTSPEIKAVCADEKKYAIVDDIVDKMKKRFPNQVVDINGARVEFEDGWGLVRASSNLPELVLIFEGKDENTVKNIRKIFREVLSEYSDISSEWQNDIE